MKRREKKEQIKRRCKREKEREMARESEARRFSHAINRYGIYFFNLNFFSEPYSHLISIFLLPPAGRRFVLFVELFFLGTHIIMLISPVFFFNANIINNLPQTQVNFQHQELKVFYRIIFNQFI